MIQQTTESLVIVLSFFYHPFFFLSIRTVTATTETEHDTLNPYIPSPSPPRLHHPRLTSSCQPLRPQPVPSQHTDDEHVGVVPVSGSGQRDQRVLVVAVVVDDGRHRGPRVLDVVVVTPQVAVLDDRGVVRLWCGLEYRSGQVRSGRDSEQNEHQIRNCGNSERGSACRLSTAPGDKIST